MEILKNFNLKDYNTFNLEVCADYFAEAEIIDDLHEIRAFIKNNKTNYYILGGGSNILFKQDFKGLIFRYIKDDIRIIDEDNEIVYIEVSAGTNWDKFVEFCVNKNYFGAENLSLIPGNVGASPIQNIGAYGVELQDFFYKLEFFNFETGRLEYYLREECKFGYRTSKFKYDLKNKGIITKVTFKLSKIRKFNLTYKALENYLQGMKEFDLIDVRKAVINIRESKIPDYKKYGNAGSFFKNPEVDKDKFKELIEKYSDLVYFTVNENKYKLSAGWIIEKCGFKGKRIDDVGCYEKQALILVNYGKAKGSEIVSFSEKIKKTVLSKFSIELETEVNII
ncbi:MAG TPA: UDP-N-acetylmuramate dehydrogenase [Melioribacteraceae bacterium]|nr:UDP-N-acetylmuramate dehydrogenase [Melioribacteraceae bacterium]